MDLEKTYLLDEEIDALETGASIEKRFEELVDVPEKKEKRKAKVNINSFVRISESVKAISESVGSTAEKVGLSAETIERTVDKVGKTAVKIGKVIGKTSGDVFDKIKTTDYEEVGKNIKNSAETTIKTVSVKSKELVDNASNPITTEQMQGILDTCYEKSVNGIPGVSKKIDQLANDYLSKYDNPEVAAKALINNQLAKCSTSGFLTGLGGLITLPVAIPANIASVLYVQMRMIAAVAYIGGFDPSDDQVQTMVYVCLTGQAVGDVFKSAGIQIGNKLATSGVQKIAGTTLTKINQKVGFRLITKFGEKGIINLGKIIPVVGGVVGGGFDYVTTRVIAKNAYNAFIVKEY